MSFISFNYFLFLSITFIAYYAVNNKLKYLVIFIASICFIYSISLNALLFSVLFAVINYSGGILLFKSGKNKNWSKITFWLFIGLDIGILAFYKYINFIFENVEFIGEIIRIQANIHPIDLILPVGISYYTFQSIGYLIRINRGSEIPEKNVIIFSSFLLFFPKFLSGPVERSNHFLPQIKNLKNFNSSLVTAGLRLILFGAFKKMVIADNLFGPVSMVYSNVENYSGNPLIIVLLLQLIYIYCDFSGYTDIALGSAKLLGIDLIDNFNRPFLAKNITEFWKRWHISLSSWCNEFIFLPFIVKYRKQGNKAAVKAIFLTFIIIGIWHGANWTYVILGLMQAIAIVYEFFTKKYRIKIASGFPKWIVNIFSRILVYIFMGISMVFFFSESVHDAFYYLSHLFSNFELTFSTYALIQDKTKFLLAICCFLILFIIEIFNEKDYNLQDLFLKQSRWFHWTIYYILIVLIYFFNSEISTFVYMNF